MFTITPMARGLGNVWEVVVVGKRGTFRGICKTEQDAQGVAQHYGRVLRAI